MQVKVASPEESGRIVAYENVYFSNGNYDRRSSNLADKWKCEMPSCIWKKLLLFTAFTLLEQDCPNYRQSWKD